MVPLSKSGVREHRGFESLPLRQTRTSWTGHPCVAGCARSLTHRRVRSLSCSPAPWADLVPEAREFRRYVGRNRHRCGRWCGQRFVGTRAPTPAQSGSFLSERSPSGLWRRTGNAVRGNPSRVRIPPSPPHLLATWCPGCSYPEQRQAAGSRSPSPVHSTFRSSQFRDRRAAIARSAFGYEQPDR